MVFVQISTSIMSGSMVQDGIYLFFFFPSDSELLVMWVCQFSSSSWKRKNEWRQSTLLYSVATDYSPAREDTGIYPQALLSSHSQCDINSNFKEQEKLC